MTRNCESLSIGKERYEAGPEPIVSGPFFFSLPDPFMGPVFHMKGARPAGTELSALVSFAIARDGKIKDLQIARKSGDETFDFAATSAVINAGPFAPLPMYYEKDELTVSVEFRQEK